MYKREVSRAKQQQTCMVPRLKEIHILRDSWTKLNVSPAKIMQVCLIVLFINVFYVFTARASIDGAIVAHTPRSATCWRWCNCWGSQVFRGMQFAFREGISEPWEGFLHGFNSPAEYFKWLPVFHVMTVNTCLKVCCCIAVLFSCHWHISDGQFPHTSSTQKAFLSWLSKWAVLTFYLYFRYIAWDMLRIDVYGFQQFCTYFFEKYPGYFVPPLRISGSVV